MASKILPRTASVFGFTPNFGQVVPKMIKDAAIEARHIDEGEILPKHLTNVTVSGAATAIPFTIQYAVTADATSGLAIKNANLEQGVTIIDVIVQCTSAVASGTMKITDGTHDITDAIICAVNKVIHRAGTIDATYASLATGATLKVVSHAAGDRGIVTLVCVKQAN